jgi:hypothetical protein
MYNRVGHNDFVMSWPALSRPRAPQPGPGQQGASSSEQQRRQPQFLPLPAGAVFQQLPPHGRDLLSILTGRVQVRYVTAADAASASRRCPESKL